MPDATPDRSWLSALNDEVLRSRFDAGALQRGRAYAAGNRVGRIDSGDHGRLLTARVHGSDALPYQVLVLADPSRPAGLSSRCSCPMRADCKHVVALITAAQAALAPAAATTWELVLDEALGAAQREAAQSRQSRALALQFAFGSVGTRNRWGADPASNAPRLRIRPLLLSDAQRWVKQGASWSDVLQNSPYHPLHPRQRDILRRLHGLRLTNRYAYYDTPEYLDVADLGPPAWPLLREAREVGIVFVPGKRDEPPIQLVADATFRLGLSRDPHGGLELQPRLEVDGLVSQPQEVTLIGAPAHGVVRRRIAAPNAEGALLVAALERPLRPTEQALAAGPERITVPRSDVERFVASYYPALRTAIAVAADDDVNLPHIAPARLELEATFSEGLEVLLRWSFRYAGDTVHHVSVVAPTVQAPPQSPVPGDIGAHRAHQPRPAVVRDLDAETAIIDSLPTPERPPGLTTKVGQRRVLAPSQRFRDLDAVDVATILIPQLAARDDVDVVVIGDLPQFRQAQSVPLIQMRAHEVDPDDAHDRTDWFDLGLNVSVDGEGVPFVDLFTALVKGDSHLVLGSGTYFALDIPELDQLRDLIEESRHLFDPVAGTLRVGPEHAGLWDELVAIGVVAQQSEQWVRAVGALLDHDDLPPIDPPAGLTAKLRPYQLDGFRWLSLLMDAHLGGVLADDMGLGKTVQTLAMAARAAESGALEEAPLLVVAPTSVLATWAQEAATFTPQLRVRTLTETSRRRRTPLAQAVADAHIVITSYAILRLDAADFTARDWGGLVLDEAQFVKNHRSKTYQAVRKIRARGRLVLTGTPLENNLMDLWSLLSIAAPGLFPDPQAFADVYRRPIEEGTDPAKLPRLLRHIRPLVLRRTKEAVASELPPKQEQVVRVPLAPSHRRRYDTHLHRERQKVLKLLADDDVGRHRVTIFRSLTLLRLLSLAPSLVDADDPTPGTKIDVLMELLDDVVSGGHRALVFSQFTGFLTLVRERLDQEGIGHVYLDGRTRNRQRRIEEFKNGVDPVFCISLKAGGFGLTLTEADYVFVLDPWWNPAAENQAIDRTHRIGQDKHVMVYRIVAADTIEDKVVALQQRKRDLFDAVIGDAADMAAPLDAADIRALLAD